VVHRESPFRALVQVSQGVTPGRWQAIVVHHAASEGASPAEIDGWHRQRGWDGLGYHFVIGNGVGYPDGAIFVGARWRLQKTGAHCKVFAGRYLGVFRPDNYYNERGIGICLLGNFERSSPTPRQREALTQLILALCEETGIDPHNVHGHGEITQRTACPGRTLDMRRVRGEVLADSARSGFVARAAAP
jgi:hypothetical protein